MFIDTPGNTLKIAAIGAEEGGDGTHFLLKMRQDASQFFLANVNAKPSQAHLKEVAGYLSEITEIAFSVDQVEQLLSLYPQVRIKLAVHGGIGDTDVRDDLSNLVAHFFLACTWPVFGDNIDPDAFLALLQKQAIAMGYHKL